MTEHTSRLAGFHKLKPSERTERVTALAGLGPEAAAHYAAAAGELLALADRLVENAVSTLNVPLGIATNLLVDGREVLVPMATEESSVIAAVSNAAKRCRASGGFVTATSGNEMIAQIQQLGMPDAAQVRLKVLERKAEIREICDAADPMLVELGGGFRDLEVRVIETAEGPMVITHLIVDTCDAMGANAVNTMAEAVAPRLAEWTGARTHLRILSNLADRRLVRARAVWALDEIGGPEVRDGILSAYRFAEADPYRATTHNKGIMNGVTGVVLATGNDTRAVEAGAHAYAARDGRYRSLSRWETDAAGDLVGVLEMPLAVGLVGGATRLHPTAQQNLKVLGVETAEGLARIIGAVGLAQNFAALRALATTGIQKGHMALHAQNVALLAGALGDEVDALAAALVEAGEVRQDVAERLLKELRAKKS